MIYSAVEQFLPAVVAGSLLTAVLRRAAPRSLWMLPGLWQLLFSLEVFASCRFLPRGTFCVGVWRSGVAIGHSPHGRWAFRLESAISWWRVCCSSDINGRMKKTKSRRRPAHPFAYEGLDRVMHERARLGVLTSLLAHPTGLSFAAIKQLCGLTDGNLSRHLDVLESARLIEMTRATGVGRPQSRCRITAEGRRRFLSYLSVLERVLLDAGSASEHEERRPRDLLRLEAR